VKPITRIAHLIEKNKKQEEKVKVLKEKVKLLESQGFIESANRIKLQIKIIEDQIGLRNKKIQTGEGSS
jgi:cell division protein FtsB